MSTTTWKLDPAHTDITFSAKHMMITTVRGTFADVDGTLEIDDANPATASGVIRVQTASLSTGFGARDTHLRSADFFDVETWPEIVVRFDGVRHVKGDDYHVTADVTIRDVTRPVTFDVELEGIGVDGKGGQHLGASASITLDRKDFGLVWNQPVQNGVLVGDKVKIDIGLEALDAASAKAMGLAA